MRIIIVTAILILIPIFGFAQDCVLIPDNSFCGVAITATRDQFVKVLGDPDGQIKMGTDRIGYLYGPRLLLIFWHDKLWEIYAWETNPNIDFWDYVKNQDTRTVMRLKFEKWSPWGLSRKQMEKYDSEFPVEDADMFVELRKSGNTDIGIFYSPFYSLDSSLSDNNDWESYKVQSIKVTFNNSKKKP